MIELYEKLTQYSQSDYYGFHMPGHKRNIGQTGSMLPYKIDITEIEGFDDLHHAKGVLKAAQERAASVYHADETCYLVNGSTSGILSAVLGCTRKGERILVARNCHKSVYAAVYMNELRTQYIYPQYDFEKGLNGAIDVYALSNILKEDKRQNGGKTTIRAVVIVSPTYDGVVSDVKAISETVHEFGIPLIVDEAHGAHFGFYPYFPKNSNQQGADVVIHSLHKTLPSLTQTALIHMNGTLVNRERIRRYVHMIQTSSPSYVLMASMDECIRFLENGTEAFEVYERRLQSLREELGNLRNLHIEETEMYDYSKIIISARGTIRKKTGNRYSGKMLYEELLENYHLQMEMASEEYVLAMTSVCDTEEGYRRLREALFEIDAKLALREENIICMKLPRLEAVYTSAETDYFKEKDSTSEHISEVVPLEKCKNRVSMEYAYIYPPGIPLIVPGERITGEAEDMLLLYRRTGFDISGLRFEDKIEVLIEK